MTRSLSSAFAALLALAAGCGSDSPTDLSATPPSLDEAITQMALVEPSGYADVNNVVADKVTSAVPAVTLPTFNTSLCTYNTGTYNFDCPAIVSGAYRFTLTYSLYDTAGVEQNAFDPKSTDRVDAVVQLSATLNTVADGKALAGGMHRQRTVTLTGLHGATQCTGASGACRVINGTLSEDDSLVSGSGTSAITTKLSVGGTVEEVNVPAGRTDYPVSGVVTTQMTVSASTSGAATLPQTAQSWLTFTGTKNATLDVTFSSHAWSCTIDLSGAAPYICTQQ